MIVLKGYGVSPGIQIGKAYKIENEEIPVKKIYIDDVEFEIKRFRNAVEISKKHIATVQKNVLEEIGHEEAKIFVAHFMILEDSEYINKIENRIRNDRLNAEYAIKEITEMFIRLFIGIDNEYMKERTLDITDVANKLIKVLHGIEIQEISKLKEQVIIVKKDLTPFELVRMDKEKVLAFVTEYGGKTSHSIIMARTLEISAVVGLEGIMDRVNNNDLLILDGEEGIVVINPSEEILEKYTIKKQEYLEHINMLKEYKNRKSLTKDGKKVKIVANISAPEDVIRVLKNTEEGIGLFRTEYLYIDRDKVPSEEEQFKAYKEVAEKLNGSPVVIRTLDIAGDKNIPYFNLPKEKNPFLGYRAIRFCLEHKEVFMSQIKAILRASYYGNVKMMFPMISSIQELREVKKIVEEVKGRLREEKVNFDDSIKVGIMVEIPSVAIMSDIFAKEVDFFSIGTNDLIQYTTAVDRMNQKVSNLYSHYHPAVLRLIKTVIDNGHKEGIWVGVCGEAACDPYLTPILVGMGIDELSMSNSSILKAKWLISQTIESEIKSKIDQILNLPTADDVEKYVRGILLGR